MPNPKEFKSKESFLDACFSKARDEGLSHKHAQGKCLGMAREHFGGGGSNRPTKKGGK